MSGILSLVRAAYPDESDIASLKTYYDHLWAARMKVDGYLGGQAWVDTQDERSIVVLHRYRDASAANAGQKIVAKSPLMTERSHLTSEPSDVTSIQIIEDYGLLRDDFTSAKFLSISMRIAEPGYAKEMEEDLREVFLESMLIEGYTGHMIGVKDGLEEEVFGLASWSSEEAFRLSLPEGIIATVKCFRRAWDS